jgi:hypothetical protein
MAGAGIPLLPPAVTFRGKHTPIQIDVTARPWLRPRPCVCCDNTPTRLYAAGWRCEKHAASDLTGAFAAITGKLFDGSLFTR